MIRFEDIADFVRNSPTVSLLRSQNAPHILYFLHAQFKATSRVSVGMSDLSSALEAYRTSVREADTEALPETAEQYINDWCRGTTRWLRRTFELGDVEPALQLTPYSEDALQLLERVVGRDSGVVSTQSRLRMVILALEDLVAGASPDPHVRLQHLEEQRRRLDEEIEKVLTEGVTSRYEPAAIRERFNAAVGLLRELLSDFRAVEERFRGIATEVQRRHAVGTERRGSILGFALDAEDELLTRNDQGITFKEFTRFILAPNQQERLEGVIAGLKAIDELHDQVAGMLTIDRMLPQLSVEARQVMRTNERLSRSLRRLLDLRSAGERQQLGRVLGDVLAVGASMSEAPPRQVTVDVDEAPDLRSPDARGFWSRAPGVSSVDLVPLVSDDRRRSAAFAQLAKLEALDWDRMRRRIRDHLDARASASLGTLIEKFPPRVGVIEVMGYIQLAREDRHVVNKEMTEVVIVRSEGRTLRVTIPLVVFVPEVGGVT